MEYQTEIADEPNPFLYKNFLNRYSDMSRDGLPSASQPNRNGAANHFRATTTVPQAQIRLPHRGVVPPVRLQHQELPLRLPNNGSVAPKGHEVHDIFAHSGDEGNDVDEYHMNLPTHTYLQREWQANAGVGSNNKEGDDPSWLLPSHQNGSPSGLHTFQNFPSDISPPSGFEPHVLSSNLPNDGMHPALRRNGSERSFSNRLPSDSSVTNLEGLSSGIDYPAGGSRLDDRLFINKLRKEVASYKRKLEEYEHYISQASQEIQQCHVEIDDLRMREKNETDAMEKVIHQVEANLQATTRRAMEAEAALSSMIDENRGLKEHIAELTADNDTLRAKASNDFRRLPAFDRARSLARFLQTSCNSANMMLKEMLDGVEQIHLASVALESIGSIEEAPGEQSSSCSGEKKNSEQQLSTNSASNSNTRSEF